MTMPDCERDLYADLGVGANATTEQLRRAYRGLARRLHPDLNPAPDASDRFARVAAAYAVLADPARRDTYDQTRTTATTAADAASTEAGSAPAGAARVYDDYAPAGGPVAFDDYAPVNDYRSPTPPARPPSPPPRPAAPRWAASRYVPPTRAPFPTWWPAGRLDHRRPGGRLLLTVWRLAPLPANRVGLVVTVLATLAVAYIAAASLQTLPLQATAIGALSVVALSCWAIRALVWAVLHARARRVVKETR